MFKASAPDCVSIDPRGKKAWGLDLSDIKNNKYKS